MCIQLITNKLHWFHTHTHTLGLTEVCRAGEAPKKLCGSITKLCVDCAAMHDLRVSVCVRERVCVCVCKCSEKSHNYLSVCVCVTVCGNIIHQPWPRGPWRFWPDKTKTNLAGLLFVGRERGKGRAACLQGVHS